ncbi:MAG: hypothetical protein ACRCXL_01240, partial [Dermatophilaceae bacterium]
MVTTTRRVWLVVAAVVTVVSGAACSADTASPAGDDTSSGAGRANGGGAPIALDQVRMPVGVEPVAVTSAGDQVLVGGRAPDGSSVRPRLYLGPDAARLAEVPVAPVSPTAFEAKWFQLDLTAK